MGDDVRVVLIKLADRLHNMRTLSHPARKSRPALPRNPGNLRAPGQPAGHLAAEVGAGRPQLSLYHTRALSRNRRPDRRTPGRPRSMTLTSTSVEHVRGLAAGAQHRGRPHSAGPSTSTRSIEDGTQGGAFDEVYDVRAVRVIVDDQSHLLFCARHHPQLVEALPGQFDDYIATPKDNFYQSLHTAVVYDDGQDSRAPNTHARDA